MVKGQVEQAAALVVEESQILCECESLDKNLHNPVGKLKWSKKIKIKKSTFTTRIRANSIEFLPL